VTGAAADASPRIGPRVRVSPALLAEGIRRLRLAGIAAAQRDAEWLLTGLCGVDRLRLYADFPLVDPWVVERYREALRRRIRGEPIQYLLGWADFAGLRVYVTPAVLIPRPETEGLAEWALDAMAPDAVIADIGTGSGCLAVTLAVRRPDARVWAIDRSLPALAVAADNARRQGVAERVRFVAADLLEAFGARPAFDLIVANPPYIPSAAIAGLPREVRDWEPHQALDGGPDGMALHGRLIPQAREVLYSGGRLVLEVGDGQAPGIAARMAAAGFTDVAVRRDLNGTERYVSGRRPVESAGAREPVSVIRLLSTGRG
jgi:release factor glutamine methyltransferase